MEAIMPRRTPLELAYPWASSDTSLPGVQANLGITIGAAVEFADVVLVRCGPPIDAANLSASTVIVVFNATLLGRFQT
jgi:hypothetical protein